MTGQELSKTIIAVTGIVAGAWVIKGIVAPAIANAFKTKRKELETKVELAKNEKEKEYLTAIQSITHETISNTRNC